MFERIAAWNVSSTDNNGIFTLCIDGRLFPNEVINAVVDVSVLDTKKSLMNIPVNEEIYDMVKESAFMALYELVYPDFDNEEDRVNDYRYEIAPSYLTDINNLVFAVEARGKIRILAGKPEYDFEKKCDIFDNMEITEVVLEKKDIEEITKQIEA